MSGHTITPIDNSQRQQVVEHTNHIVDLAAGLFDLSLPAIAVRFDLRGRSAGMYKAQGSERLIRYNPWVFAIAFDDNLTQTVPHEVAHYAVDIRYGRRVKPHGPEWKNTMKAMGYVPTVTCNYALQGVPTRQVRRFRYQCRCQTHSLTSYRHFRILRGAAKYLCRQCRQPLVAA